MTETDLQLGGGYTYQWECAILLALNYFFQPVRYNPILYDLVTGHLGEVTEILLEGEDRERGVELEDITLVGGERRIIVQVKTKQAEGERWTLTDSLLLKALYRFYDSRLLEEQPGDIRFVFLTNRPFNPDLVRIKDTIRTGTLDHCPEADKLYEYLGRYARAEKGASLERGRFRQMLACTALVEYLAVDTVKANVQAKLQAYGRPDWQQAHAVLFEHFARQSTRRGGGSVTRESIGEVLGPGIQAEQKAKPPPFTVPFIRNPDFMGRQEDLERLHGALRGETPVGIRPAGLTGMGGIGKTQLAVEYAYRYRDAYPGGVLWINAAERLAPGFAALGCQLRPTTADQSQEEQIRAVADYVHRQPDTLLVLDNLADPAALNHPVASGVIPAALPCRVLFTTRRRDLGRFTPVEVTVLPEEPALQLLLRYPDRRPILAPSHPERDVARSICHLLGRLPLALEVAGAFLGEWPDVPLADFRGRLRREGCLATLDEEAGELPPASLSLIHDAAVTATLKTQWDALIDPDAHLLLRVAGQLPEAAQIPVARLGLLSGIPDDGRPGRPSRLARALRHLERASLVEELEQAQVRLHPLVWDFAADQTAEAEAPDFRRWCAANLAAAYEEVATLEDHCARRGIDALQGDLLTAFNLLPAELQAPGEEPRTNLQNLLRLVQREAHNLRRWEPGQSPGFFVQQVHYRAASHGFVRLAAGAAAYLTEQAIPFLRRQWQANWESLALERTLTGHEDVVYAVVLMPDGRRAVSASSDRTLKVWDLASGQELATLHGHEHEVNAVALTPDGRRAVSASHDETLKVWDLTSGEELATLRGHEGAVNAVAVTPDGWRAVSASTDGTLRIWDLATGQAVATLRGHEHQVNAVAVTPDGQGAVSASTDGTLRVWDLATGQAVATLRGHESGVGAVAVTPDGQGAVSASWDGTLRVWDLVTSQAVATLRSHESLGGTVALTPDGQGVVLAYLGGTLRVWDLATGQAVATLRGHEDWVNAVAVTPDGQRAVSASGDWTLRVWDLAAGGALAIGEELATLRGHEAEVNAVAVTPDGRRAVSASGDGTLRAWDLATGQAVATLRGHENSVNAMALTPDGQGAVSASDDGTLRVWDLATGQAVATLRGHEHQVNAVAVSPDGQRAVSASGDWTLRVWDLATGQAVATLRGHEDWVWGVAVTPDGWRAVSASWDGTLRIWDLATGQAVATLRGHEAGVWDVAVTPDGRRAVSASGDRTLRIWDLATGQAVATLRGHEDMVFAVVLTPDGRRVVSASNDRTLRVWDLASGQELAMVALDGGLRSVAMASDGVTIVIGDRAGSVYCLRYVQPPRAEAE